MPSMIDTPSLQHLLLLKTSTPRLGLMELSAILPFVCILLVLSGSHVESRGDPRPADGSSSTSLFVFGDSFGDNGNLPKSDISYMSRQWYWPYGSADSTWGPTGRFSNAIVQSDLVAMILGRQESPPAYRRRSNYNQPLGMNFAAGGAGVYEDTYKAPTLHRQVDHFRDLVQDGSITRRQLRDSVALIAISGNDYIGSSVAAMSTDQLIDYVGNVTSEIVKQVKRLQNHGIRKILVNNMQPLGCTPWQTRPGNYAKCAYRDNVDVAVSIHNDRLESKLQDKEDVLVLDLYTAFANIVDDIYQDSDNEVSKQFKHKHSPCCESISPGGYCGQRDQDDADMYTVCANPDKHFYWDDMHPTDVGWRAVMGQLDDPIKEFLGLN